jgi:hypothetical protein
MDQQIADELLVQFADELQVGDHMLTAIISLRLLVCLYAIKSRHAG